MIYTEKQVKKFIRKAVTATTDSVIKWFEEETIVIDKTTGKELLNTEITLKKNSKKLEDYVYPALKKKGITIEPKL